MNAIIFFAIFSFVSANDDGVNDCQFIANCSKSDENNEKECYNCVSQYDILETYILGNNAILSNLANAFYRSDEDPAEFMKITYQYQILNDSSNNTDYCFDKKRVYFWSTSPSYLLGPGPLFFLSLFAVNPSQSSVSIQLPCLHQDSLKHLLSRLTFLVSLLVS